MLLTTRGQKSLAFLALSYLVLSWLNSRILVKENQVLIQPSSRMYILSFAKGGKK